MRKTSGSGKGSGKGSEKGSGKGSGKSSGDSSGETVRRGRPTGGEATLSHIDRAGRIRMVDVGGKAPTARTARAGGTVMLSAEAVALLRRGEIAKGNVLAAAKTAGILAAKRTPELIPLCHPLLLEHIDLEFELKADRVEICSSVRLTGRTGAEMEALTAVAVAALTIYDMCKAVDKRMTIDQIRLLEKTGGKSGIFRAP